MVLTRGKLVFPSPRGGAYRRPGRLIERALKCMPNGLIGFQLGHIPTSEVAQAYYTNPQVQFLKDYAASLPAPKLKPESANSVTPIREGCAKAVRCEGRALPELAGLVRRDTVDAHITKYELGARRSSVIVAAP